jgi:MoxR-like ATPase
VSVADDVLGYVVDLAQATRRSPSVQLGVSPRATTALLAAAKVWAWLGGYPAITPDHVQTMLVPTWRHRIRLRPDAELEGVSVDSVLASVVQQTRVPV